jgi:hypothetical protein
MEHPTRPHFGIASNQVVRALTDLLKTLQQPDANFFQTERPVILTEIAPYGKI